MRTLLITGFDPFGGGTVNPSWEAVRRLPDQIGDYVLCKLRIPTVFGEAAAMAAEKAVEIGADVIISVGQAGGRSAVTPERVAVNLRDARIPDNRGNQPDETPVVPGGETAYFSTLPVKAMARAIEEAGLPGKVSDSAGTFVCNDVLYTLLHRFRGTGVRVGFIHVPWLPEQGTPALPLDDTMRALIAAIEAAG